jgi:nucleotide-binding universal stress UspA family protein
VSAPIVVGYDGSPPARAALDRGIEEAARAGAQVVVVTVVPVPLDVEGPRTFGTPGDGLVPVIPLVPPAEAEALLADARDRIEAAGVQGEYVWETGDAAAAIVREAKDRSAAAVVVGHEHHTRLGRWLGTDTAAEIERAAGCPVIVVDP